MLLFPDQPSQRFKVKPKLKPISQSNKPQYLLCNCSWKRLVCVTFPVIHWMRSLLCSFFRQGRLSVRRWVAATNFCMMSVTLLKHENSLCIFECLVKQFSCRCWLSWLMLQQLQGFGENSAVTSELILFFGKRQLEGTLGPSYKQTEWTHP